MSEFKREHRYWVFKRKHMSGKEDAALRRTSNNLKLLDPEITPNCVVVEEDWPEYEVVWEMVQDRVEGRPNRIVKLESELSTLKAQREWVSVVQDKPWKHPPDREDILVLYDNGLMDRAQYTCGAPPFTDDSWYLPCGPEPVQDGRIVAWRYLPPAPGVK